MYTKKLIITGIFCSLMATLFFTFRTVPQATLDLRNTYRASGALENVFNTTENVVFNVKDSNTMYHLDLSSEAGVTFVEVKQAFTGKPAEIYYAKQLTSPPKRPVFHQIARVNLSQRPSFSAASR